MDALKAEVDRIRAERALGRSDALVRLFDYLADQALAGHPVREADIAAEVFGRGAGLSGDASIRVYVHRLRKKLDDFYAGREPRLTIPLGEYRLTLADPNAPVDVAGTPPRRPALTWRTGLPIAAILLVIAAGALGVWGWRASAPARQVAHAAAAPLWSGVGQDRPVLLVVGDYYIFGDTDGGDRPQRMIRGFEINSPADLEMMLLERPELQGRYVDLDTYYTPVGATLALPHVLPVVRRLARSGERLRVVTSSQLTPDLLTSHDVVYVGYFSALRLLQGPAFQASRLRIGETFDELVDRRTGKIYLSNAGAAGPGRPNQDYGYLAALRGPAGNRIVVIAGGRDIGVLQAARLAASAPPDGQDPDGRLEILYRVDGLGRTGVSATRVMGPGGG